MGRGVFPGNRCEKMERAKLFIEINTIIDLSVAN
jgi:hypothetical protein